MRALTVKQLKVDVKLKVLTATAGFNVVYQPAFASCHLEFRRALLTNLPGTPILSTMIGIRGTVRLRLEHRFVNFVLQSDHFLVFVGRLLSSLWQSL